MAKLPITILINSQFSQSLLKSRLKFLNQLQSPYLAIKFLPGLAHPRPVYISLLISGKLNIGMN